MEFFFKDQSLFDGYCYQLQSSDINNYPNITITTKNGISITVPPQVYIFLLIYFIIFRII